MKKNSDYILYLDMDGVLVDFDGGFKKITHGMNRSDMINTQGEKAVRDKYLTAGIDFWANLEWIDGGRELWDSSNQLFNHVRILSSAGTTDVEKGKMVDEGKRNWLKKNIPSINQTNVFIVNGKHMKKKYASKNSILVDDVGITIKEWNQNGGYGILHNSKFYKKTIEDLVDISQPMNISEIAKRYLN